MTKFLKRKSKKSEKQVVFDEETLSHDKACREYYKQKQMLINGDDQDDDDEIPVKKMHAIITTSRTEQEITNCFIKWNRK